jgi:calcineurin-like phosphoesterase family protein
LSTVFFIGDTHFGHERVFEKGAWPEFDSIEEHDEEIIRRWNVVVRPKDIVWHLGDVGMWGLPSLAPVRELNGKKRLIRGNHDALRDEDYLGAGFERVVFGPGLEKYGAWLSHMPIHPQCVGRFGRNIHAHTHRSRPLAPLGPWNDERYVCVSCEQVAFAPLSLEEIRGVPPRR